MSVNIEDFPFGGQINEIIPGVVTSINGETGAVILESTNGSITFSYPDAQHINLEAVGGGSGSGNLGIVNLNNYSIGGVNDTASIQAAFTAACTVSSFPNGACVFFPGNLTPVITGPILVGPAVPTSAVNPNGVWMLGGGKQTSVVTVAANGGAFGFSLSSGIAPTAGQTVSLTFTDTTTALTYTSPTYTVTAWDSLRTIVQNLVALIAADTSASQPVTGTAPWMNAITWTDNSTGKGTPIARVSEINFSLTPAAYAHPGSFSATIGGGGNLVVSTQNSGAFGPTAVNYDVFVCPSVVGNTGGWTAANGFGAKGINFVFAGNGYWYGTSGHPGPSGALAGALFVTPAGQNMEYGSLVVNNGWTLVRDSQVPPATGTSGNRSFTTWRDSNLNCNGHMFQFNGSSGNFYIEECYVHGGNSQDPYHAAFFFSDPPPNTLGSNGFNMEQFRIGAGVDVEGYGWGIYYSGYNMAINDSDLGAHWIASDSSCMSAIYLQTRPYAQPGPGSGGGASSGNLKIGPAFASAGTHSVWLDAGVVNGQNPGSYGALQDIKIWGPGGPQAGNATSNWKQPFGMVQIGNPPQTVGLTVPAGGYPAPTLSYTNVGGTGLSPGNYAVQVAFGNSSGLTQASAIATITVPSGYSSTGQLIIAYTAPTNAGYCGVYVNFVGSGANGTPTLQFVANASGDNTFESSEYLTTTPTPNTNNCSGAGFAAGITFTVTITDATAGITWTPSYTTLGGETMQQVAQYLANLLNSYSNWATYSNGTVTVGWIPAWAFEGMLFFEQAPLPTSSPVYDGITYTASISVSPYIAAYGGGSGSPFATMYVPSAFANSGNICLLAAYNATSSITAAITNNQGNTTATTASGVVAFGNAFELSGYVGLVFLDGVACKASNGIGIHLLATYDTVITGGQCTRSATNTSPGGTGIQIEQNNYGFNSGNKLGGFRIKGFDATECATYLVDNFSAANPATTPTGALVLSPAPCYIGGLAPYSARSVYPIAQPSFPANGPQYAITNPGPYDCDFYFTGSLPTLSEVVEYQTKGGAAFAAGHISLTTPGSTGSTGTFTFAGWHSFTVTGVNCTSGNAVAASLNANSTFAQYFYATVSGSPAVITVTSLIPGTGPNSETCAISALTNGAVFSAGGFTFTGGAGTGYSWGAAASQREFYIPVGNTIVFSYSTGTPTAALLGR